jgi:hypothetical protein
MTPEERPQDVRPQQESATGKPMVPSTPRDVVHIRLGSFALVFEFALGAAGLIAGIPWLTVVAAILIVITAIDIGLAVRRQSRRGAGEAG